MLVATGARVCMTEVTPSVVPTAEFNLSVMSSVIDDDDDDDDDDDEGTVVECH